RFSSPSPFFRVSMQPSPQDLARCNSAAVDLAVEGVWNVARTAFTQLAPPLCCLLLPVWSDELGDPCEMCGDYVARKRTSAATVNLDFVEPLLSQKDMSVTTYNSGPVRM